MLTQSVLLVRKERTLLTVDLSCSKSLCPVFRGAEDRPWVLAGEFEIDHGRGGVPLASSLQIFDKQFSKHSEFLIPVQLAKFAEHFGDCTLARVRGKRAADVGATPCQFKHVSCASMGRGAAASAFPWHDRVSLFCTFS